MGRCTRTGNSSKGRAVGSKVNFWCTRVLKYLWCEVTSLGNALSEILSEL